MTLRATLALAALVSCALAVPGAAQPQSSLPDLEVEDVQVVGSPQVLDGQAQGATIATTVRNNGPVAVSGYRLVYAWVLSGGGQIPLNAGPATASTDVQERTLAAGTAAHHQWAWALQPSQRGAGAVRVTVELASASTTDREPANNARAQDTFVTVRSVAASFPTTPVDLHADETRFVRLAVRNDGNIAETVALRIAPPTGDANRLRLELDPASLVVPAGGAATATLLVTFPFDFDTTPINAAVTVVANAYGSDRAVAAPPLRSTDAPYSPSAFQSTLNGPPRLVAPAPGQAVEQPFTLRNTGTDQDIYDVSVDAPPGWSLEATPARVLLQPGESQAVRLRAVAPADASPSHAAQGTLRAESVHPAAPTQAAVDLRVSGPALRLAIEVPAGTAYVRDNVTVAVVAANEGDQPSAARRVGLHGVGAAQGIAADIDVPVLPAGGSFRFPVQLPTLTQAGAATLELRSAPAAEAEATAQLGVRQPRLTIVAPPPAAGVAGQQVLYAVAPAVFVVRNDGAHAEEVDLAVLATPGQAALVGPSRLELAPGEARSVAVAQWLPAQPGPLAKAPLNFTARIAARPSFAWHNQTATQLADTLGPQAAVAERANAWTVGRPYPVAVQAADPAGVASVRLTITPPQGANVTVALTASADGTWRGNATFAVPGEHRLSAVATDRRGNAGAPATWFAAAHAAPVPRIQVTVPAGGGWDLADPLPVQVLDGEAQRLRFTVRQDGQVIHEGEVGLSAGAAAVPLGPAVAGDAIVRLEAVGEGPSGETTLVLRLTKRNATADPDPVPREAWADGKESPTPMAASLAAVAVGVLLARRRRGG